MLLLKYFKGHLISILDRDELHDLNVQVDWQRKGGTYWVRYIHVELLTNPSSNNVNLTRYVFK